MDFKRLNENFKRFMSEEDLDYYNTDKEKDVKDVPTNTAEPKDDVVKKKRVLVACEESQALTIRFRAKGIEAFSCDTEPCSGGHPEWHIQGDVTPILNDKWDMIIIKALQNAQDTSHNRKG